MLGQDKNIAQQPFTFEQYDEDIEANVMGYACPNCHFALYTDTNLDSYEDRRGEPYCCNCGQKLDWGFSRITKLKAKLWSEYYGE